MNRPDDLQLVQLPSIDEQITQQDLVAFFQRLSNTKGEFTWSTTPKETDNQNEQL